MRNILHLETIDLFFQTLSEEWPHAAEILLVGGAVALVLGGNRPTEDIDFEVSLVPGAKRWDDFQSVVEEVKEKTKIRVQFSESIERWSMISFLDYANHKHRILFKRYGKIHVFLLKPAYWSIGKVGRYLDQDIKDMILVFSKEKIDPLALARLWRKALDQSPRSTQLFNVKKQMHHFFKRYGPKIWGRYLPLEKILPLFEKEAESA